MSWIDRHHRWATILGVVALVVALAAGGLTLWLHSEDHSQIQAQRLAQQADDRARQEAAKVTLQALHMGICPLVYTYENLGQSSPNGPQVAAGWHGVGVLLGCPDGTKP